MASPFTSLQAWLAAAGGDAACVTLTDATSTSAERGLVTAVSVDAGATLVRVPLVAACTPSSALRCPVVRALLRGDLSRLKRVLCSQDVPHPSILTLSLALLADAVRGPTSPRHPYIALLPAPPGSPFASAAPHGPAATDATLFSDEELAHLACPPFEQAVRRERDRVTRVWGELFADDPDPPVSLPSFLWAHALVRSRALDLRLVGVDLSTTSTSLERVLLPCVDLVQHGGRADGACVLRLVVGSDGAPTAVDLVTTTPLPSATPVCLDYGARPLRDLVRGYGFCPALPLSAPVSEIFEDISRIAPGRAMVIDATDGLHALALAHVRVLAEPGGDPALETDGASVVWCVAPPRAGAAVRVAPDGTETDMDPSDEAATARDVAAACRSLAALIEAVGGGGSDSHRDWSRREHARLATACRAARVALLHAAADGAEAQAVRLEV